MASAEQLQAIKEQLREEMRAEMMGSALSAARDPDVIRKKPEIPAFDKQHVDIWIRRMENAYIRAGIRSVREKFAFLENKFAVDMDPVINEYLWSDGTESDWDNFLKYLRKEYGLTRQQKASLFVDGFKRNGLRPSQYAAALNDKTKDVTLDDIKKEMLMRELPVEVRRMLQERIEKSSFKEAAELADSYFDRDGKPRHCNTSTVNAVTDQQQLQHRDSDSDSEDVNAINGRFRQHRVPQHQPSGAKTTRQQSTPQNANKPSSSKNNSTDNNLCFYHDKYGDKARNCQETCSLFDSKRFPGNAKAGRK